MKTAVVTKANHELYLERMSVAQRTRLLRRMQKAKLRYKKHLEDEGSTQPADLEQQRLLINDDLSQLDVQRSYLRRQGRAMHLAHAFLTGKPYIAVERTSYTWPDWDYTEYMARIMSRPVADPRDSAQRFEQWRQEGMQRGLLDRNKKGRTIKRGDYISSFPIDGTVETLAYTNLAMLAFAFGVALTVLWIMWS